MFLEDDDHVEPCSKCRMRAFLQKCTGCACDSLPGADAAVSEAMVKLLSAAQSSSRPPAIRPHACKQACFRALELSGKILPEAMVHTQGGGSRAHVLTWLLLWVLAWTAYVCACSESAACKCMCCTKEHTAGACGVLPLIGRGSAPSPPLPSPPLRRSKASCTACSAVESRLTVELARTGPARSQESAARTATNLDCPWRFAQRKIDDGQPQEPPSPLITASAESDGRRGGGEIC
eukprot:366391-Chlamydomonas_euryale.AAC.5